MPEVTLETPTTPTDTPTPESPVATNTAETPTTILQTPVSPVNPDGTFIDGWTATLPEDLRNEECLKVVKDLPGAISQLVNAQKLVGKNKIALPNEKSTPEEWAAFHKAVGRPDKPEDYKVEVPDTLKELYPDDRMAALRKVAHEEGLTQKQVAALMKLDTETATKLIEQREQIEEQAKREAKVKADQELRREFGAAYPERIHVSNRLIEEVFGNDKEGEMAFLAKYGNDPDFVRFASKAGAKLVEHKGLIAQYEGTPAPAEAQAKIDALMATPGYLDMGSPMPQVERDAIANEIHELMKQTIPAQAGR